MLFSLASARARAIVVLIMSGVVLLAGCGGGGGGGGGSASGGGGGGGSLVFTADKSSVNFDYAQGQEPAAQVVTITATGTYSGTLYVAATASGQGLAATIPITVSGTTATAQFLPATGLAPGSYSGTVKLMACSDSACTQQVGNSPLTLAFSITVHPVLKLTPTSATLTAISGAPATQAVVVQLPQGQSGFTTQVQSGSPWLTVTGATATSFTVVAASLPSGSYQGSILVTSGNQSYVLPVAYAVSAPVGGDRQLAVTPTSLALATVEDSTSPATLTVTPPSWDSNVTAVTEYAPGGATGWLSVTPTSGGFSVVATATQLIAGSYTADIRVQGAYPASDIVVPVALTVGVGLMRPADVNVTLDAETTVSVLTGSVPVNVVAGPAVGWTATSNTAWLGLTKATGSTGSALTYAIDQTKVAALANAAAYPAQITITPASATMSPVTFTVNLAKQLPQITSLAPYVQLTGQTARVILRGSGFAAISLPAVRFVIDGAAPNTLSVTRVNDTEVVARFSALTAGSHTVSVSNALGMPTSTGAVTAVNAPSYTYAALATGGSLRSLAYDPQRNTLYAANTALEKIVSYHYAGSSWSATSVPLAAAYDVGLSQDGTALFVSSTNTQAQASAGSVGTLDPATLATLTSAVATNNLLPEFSTLGFGIPATNDGRSWLGLATTAGTDLGSIAYVTKASLAPTVLPTPSVSTSLFGGPWYAVSRDGERLLIVQSASTTPQPPMLYLNAADSVVGAIAAGPNFATYLSLSESADRVVFDSSEVRDGAFNLIGHAVIPFVTGQLVGTTYDPRDAQLSPDGSRLYVLAYRSDAATNAMVTPRVYVFDSRTTSEPLLTYGYFDIADYPSCVPNINLGVCNPTVAGAISLDGKTLFFGGDQNFIAAPVPSALNAIMSVPAGSSTKTQTRAAATPWVLDLH